MRRPREQRHRLGLVELSRLSTSTPIGAVVVEVQTELELAAQVNETQRKAEMQLIWSPKPS